MQFQVPQFIETEDKIVGPFSLREFMYVGVAGGICFILYFMIQALSVWVVFSVFIMGTGIALAFVRVHGRPLARVIRSAFSYYWEPQTYVWQPNAPKLEKNQETMQSLAGKRLSLENIMGGLALKSAWQNLQTGSKGPAKLSPRSYEDRYEIFRRLSGEQRAARRVDYR